jgi:hypothetical protein
MSQEIAEFAYDLHAGLSSLQVGSERTQDSAIDDDMIRRDAQRGRASLREERSPVSRGVR